jgi:DNA-binding beta-propeller fold protein YncE
MEMSMLKQRGGRTNDRRGAFVVALVVGAITALIVSATPALGALSFPFDGQLAPAGGSFGAVETNGVAVSDFTNDTYVADSGAGVVEAFDSSGAQVLHLDGTATPAGSFGPEGAKIGAAADNATGQVYVLDATHGVVDVFDSAGNYVCQITGSTTPSTSECNGPAGSETPAGKLTEPQGIAVDQASGEVYVLDAESGVVDVFGPGGAFERQIELSGTGFFGPTTKGLAVSGFNGHVYVGEDLTSVVYEFDATGAFVNTWTGANTPAGGFSSEVSFAADDASGRVYVTDSGHKVTNVFDSEGNFLTQFSHEFHVPRATAVDQANGKVLVGDDASAPTPQVVDVFGPAVIIPDVTTGSVSNVQATTATVGGSVNPEGFQLTDCHFDFGTDTSYGRTAPCTPSSAELPPDSAEHDVTAALSGLEAGTTYHFRLVVANANGANVGADATFTTPPKPVIDGTSVENLTAESAELVANIDPNGFETTYHFEWGTTTSYGNVDPTHVIAPETSDVRVAQNIEKLEANITYHWRVIASSVNGTVVGSDHTFVFLKRNGAGGCPNEALRVGASANLPDCRAYEMVTPPAKNGALVGAGLLITAPDVSASGSRLMISSIQCFGGALSCTAERENEGEPYAFTRTASGWQTAPLAPAPSQANANSSFIVSADTGTALFSISSEPGGQDDFYARQVDGSLVDIGPTTPPEDGLLGPAFGDFNLSATQDLSHVVYQLGAHFWPFDASQHQSVYELSGTGKTAPTLVGVSSGPGGTLISTCGTELGTAGSHHAMSADGETIYFVSFGHDDGATTCPAESPAPAADELYARVGDSNTVAISGATSSDCTTVACHNAAPSDAKFEDASRDGARVFFTDTQQLTDNASDDATITDTAARGGCRATTGTSGCNLYEYDFDQAPGHNLIAVSAGDTSGLGPNVQRVLATSDDGSRVYFVARGVLTGQAGSGGKLPIAGGENLYVYERDPSHPGGHVAFVATLSAADREETAITGVVPSVTDDGRFLVFISHADLTSDDTSTGGAAQVFRYDAQSESLVRISIGEDGFNDNGNTSNATACENTCPLDATIAAPTNIARRDPTMSDDGSYVFFASPVGLTPGALDEVQTETGEHGEPIYAQNIYSYHEGHVALISDGKDVASVYRPPHGIGAVELIGSDSTGANVFFTTADRLVAQDTDSQVDYYDARIDGGFPGTASAPTCEGADGCHGAPTVGGTSVTSGSELIVGTGNLQPAGSVAKPTRKMLTASQRLANALKACRKHRSKRRRQKCEQQAHSRYGPHRKAGHKKAKKTSGRGK